MGNMTFEVIGEDVHLPTFLKNQYDAYGGIYEKGYWLVFGNTSIKIAGNDEELGDFIDHINNMEEVMVQWRG